MTKTCPRCEETTYSDEDTNCAKCGARYDRKSFLDPNNARITVTVTKALRGELAQEAKDQEMILSEYSANILRTRHRNPTEPKPEPEPVKAQPKRSDHKKPKVSKSKKEHIGPKPELPFESEPSDKLLSEPVSAESETPNTSEKVYDLHDRTMPFEKLIAYRDSKTGEIKHGIRHRALTS